jgi:prophage antirepressor-like protein
MENGKKKVKIRVTAADGTAWWSLKDVCKALGYRGETKIKRRLDKDEFTFFGSPMAVNEAGLSHTLLISEAEVSRDFRRWLCREVIPKILRNGFYLNQ